MYKFFTKNKVKDKYKNKVFNIKWAVYRLFFFFFLIYKSSNKIHGKIFGLFLKEHSEFKIIHLLSLYILVRILVWYILLFNAEVIKTWKKKKAQNMFYRTLYRGT